MDEPSPRPEDLYKRPEELFQHPKPVSTYGESSSLPSNKKRFQSNLGAHRVKKPWQVGINEIDMMVKEAFHGQCGFDEDIDKDIDEGFDEDIDQVIGKDPSHQIIAINTTTKIKTIITSKHDHYARD